MYRTDYNILTNLTEPSPFTKRHNSHDVTLAESARGQKGMPFKITQQRKGEIFAERPNPLRPQVVEGYFKSVMAQGQKSLIKIIERIYTLNLDNRILNNLR